MRHRGVDVVGASPSTDPGCADERIPEEPGRGGRRPRVVGAVLAAVVLAAVAVVVRGGATPASPEASCPAMLDYRGDRYTSAGDLARVPTAVGTAGHATYPPCDDTGGRLPSGGGGQVSVGRIRGVDPGTAFLANGRLWLHRDVASLPGFVRASRLPVPCTLRASASGTWLSVESLRRVRCDGAAGRRTDRVLAGRRHPPSYRRGTSRWCCPSPGTRDTRTATPAEVRRTLRAVTPWASRCTATDRRFVADSLAASRLSRSGAVEEPVEDPRPELQRVDRHPLVDAVEERGEVEVGRAAAAARSRSSACRAC